MRKSKEKIKNYHNRCVNSAFALMLLLCCTSVGIITMVESKNRLTRQESLNIRSAATPTPIPTAFALVPQQFSSKAPQFDVNGLLLNPQWGWQLGYEPDFLLPDPPLNDFPDSIDTSICNNEDFSDCAGGFHPEKDGPDFGCIMCRLGHRRKNRATGHVNWFPATYTGNICFHNFSYPDMDYTFSLQPNKWAGLTRWNAPSIPPKSTGPGCGGPKGARCPSPKVFHAEFDSRETINRFVGNNEWTRFRDLANPCPPKKFKDSCKQDEARKKISNLRAVVIGLVGLDTEHEAYSELHPVYALAIETNKSHDDNTWIIFVRNQGGEGVCSHLDHVLHFSSNDSGQPVENIKLLLPPPEGMAITSPVVNRPEKTAFWGTGKPADIPKLGYYKDLTHSEDNEGVLVQFTLSCRPANTDCEQLVEGEIHLNWGNGSRPTGTPASVITPFPDYCISPNLQLAEDDDDQEFGDPTPRQSYELYKLVEKDLDSSNLIAYNSLPEVIEPVRLTVRLDGDATPFVRGAEGKSSGRLNARINELKRIFGLADK